MTLRSVVLQLREDQIAQLDADAARVGASRSKLVRDALDALLTPVADPDVVEQYRLAYPPGGVGSDAWGDLDAWHDAAAAERTTTEREQW